MYKLVDQKMRKQICFIGLAQHNAAYWFKIALFGLQYTKLLDIVFKMWLYQLKELNISSSFIVNFNSKQQVNY